MLAAVTERLKQVARRPISENSPWIHATWVSLGFRGVILDRDQAIKDGNLTAKAGIASLYSDASTTARCSAVAVTRQRGNSAEVVVQESIGWSTTCGILTAEIAAIAAALEYIQEPFEPDPRELPLFATRTRITIFSDNQLALEAIKAGSSARRGKDLLRKIAESFYALQEKDTDIEFRWVPGHSGVCGNEQADEAARAAASQARGLTASLARCVREAAELIKAIEQDRKRDSDQFDPEGLPGQHTWKLDQALPGHHTLRLYGAFTSKQASILIRLEQGAAGSINTFPV